MSSIIIKPDSIKGALTVKARSHNISMEDNIL